MNSIYYKKIEGRYRSLIKLDGVLIQYVTDTVIIEGSLTKHCVKCTFLIKDEVVIEYYNQESKGQIQCLKVGGKKIDLNGVDFYINNDKNCIMSMTVRFDTELIEFEG